MSVIINPGSDIAGGTLEQARKNAEWFLQNAAERGITDLELLPDVEQREHGRWEFTFRHRVTGKTAAVDTHGFDTAESEKFVFPPREYWNGSSTAAPDWESFLTDDYELRAVRKAT